MKKRWLISGISVVAILALVASVLWPAGHAAASFNPNLIMDDYTFSNTGTMSAGQIDAFLNAFPKSCISQNANSNGNPGFRTNDPTGWSPSEPNNHGYTFGGLVTAGQAIFDAARIYNLNPQMILATLQKEQSVVTGNPGCHYDNPSPGSACTYSGGGCVFIGMSYACPGGCNFSYNGFSLQLIAGSWLLRFAQERSLGITSGYPGYDQGDSNIGYGGARVGTPYTLVDGHTVTVQSGATGSLYYYTPFYSGNMSFDNIFEAWFGPTVGGGFELVYDSSCSSACPQYVVYSTVKQYVNATAKAAWGLTMTPQPMDSTVLSTYQTGPDLDVLATVNNNSVKTLYFMDGGHRYRIPGGSMIGTWDLQGRAISDVSPGLFTNPTEGGDLSNVVKDPSSSTYYMMDGDNGSGQVVLRPYANDTIRQAWEGNLHYVPVSSLYFDSIDNAIGSTLSSTSASCLGSNFQVNDGGKLWQSAGIGALYPAVQSVSLATFNRLPNLGFASSLIQGQGDPAVYLIDNGTKHHILGGSLLNAWAAGQAITQVNPQFVATLSTGADIGTFLAKDGSNNYYAIDRGNKYPIPTNLVTAYSAALGTTTITSNLMSLFLTGSNATGFVQGIGQPAVYLLDNSGNLHHVPNPTVAGLWGAYQVGVTQLTNSTISGLTVGADAKTYVSNGTTNYQMDVGKLASISAPVASDWGISSPLTFSDGTLSRFTTTTAITNQVSDGQTYYYIRGGNAYTTTDTNVAGMWGLTGSNVHNGSIVFSAMPTFTLTPFVQSSTNSSNYYIADNGGTWYHIPSQYVTGLIGSWPVTTLSPSFAPNSITDWTGMVVTNSSNYYVVDGGTTRPLPSGAVRDQWTNSEGTTDQAVDSYFLNLFPNGGNMSKSIIGNGPAVYAVVNEAKRHITSGALLNSTYSPVSHVSDSLINALTSGSDLP